MLISIHFPLADSRHFVEGETRRLPLPGWPWPEDGEFVRSFGAVRTRPYGGLVYPNFDEYKLCTASSIMRFEHSLNQSAKIIDQRLAFRCAFRNLHSDGNASTRIDVGFATNRIIAAESGPDLSILLEKLLSLPVSIQIIPEATKCALAHAASPLAVAYLTSSTRNRDNFVPPTWWIQAGQPTVIVQYKHHEIPTLPRYARYIRNLYAYVGLTVAHAWYPWQGRRFRVWFMGYQKHTNYDKARALRVHLARLHAEKECLRLVLKNIAVGRINPPPRSATSDALTEYLNKATRMISRSEREADLEGLDHKLFPQEIVKSIFSTEICASPGELEALQTQLDQQLRKLDIRGNIRRKSVDWVQRRFGGTLASVAHDAAASTTAPPQSTIEEMSKSWILSEVPVSLKQHSPSVEIVLLDCSVTGMPAIAQLIESICSLISGIGIQVRVYEELNKKEPEINIYTSIDEKAVEALLPAMWTSLAEIFCQAAEKLQTRSDFGSLEFQLVSQDITHHICLAHNPRTMHGVEYRDKLRKTVAELASLPDWLTAYLAASSTDGVGFSAISRVEWNLRNSFWKGTSEYKLDCAMWMPSGLLRLKTGEGKYCDWKSPIEAKVAYFHTKGPSIPMRSEHQAPRPIKLFISYSHADEEYRKRLEAHLAPLRRERLIVQWHDRMIPAGNEWAVEIDRNLAEADIVLLLISADFVASDYCFEKEMAVAMNRHIDGTAVIIPIIVRPVDFKNTLFAKLQAVPKDAKPISGWADSEEAWLDVAKAIRRVVEKLGTVPSPLCSLN